VNPSAELALFAGIMALGQFSPGPDMLLLTRTSLRHGSAAGVKMATGIACGLAVHATIAIGGMSWLIRSNALTWTLLRCAAAAYLGWLAYRILSQIRAPGESGAPEKSGLSKPFLRGLACNLTNLKAALFLAALVAPFMAGERPDGWAFALWSVIVFQALVLWSLWAVLLQWHVIKSFYQKCGRWIDAGFAIGLLAMAVRLLIF
jgi:threonine/homoserine/homoserine lactone efflux protein